MYEIVIVRAVKYEIGDIFTAYGADRFRDALWWLQQPGLTLDTALTPRSESEGVFTCAAIRFDFQMLPHIDHHHADISYLSFEYQCKGNDLFTKDLPKLVALTEQVLRRDRFAMGMVDFYVLYDLEVDEHRDSDGGLDSVGIYPELLGELNFGALPTILVPSPS